MRPLRSPLLSRSYAALPDTAMNQAMGRLARLSRPRWAVQAVIDAWARAERIDRTEFEPGPFATVHEFFLRRLRAGGRPLAEGVVSPVDGRVVSAGTLGDGPLWVKGEPLSLSRLINGAGVHRTDLRGLQGGSYAVVFLSPRGYHRVHMPEDGVVQSSQWLPGRFFPQNEDALRHIARVYERNERLVLSLQIDRHGPALLVMVGASLVGGIHLEAVPRRRFTVGGATALGHRLARGEELGHFAFGSTVVLLFPHAAALRPVVREGDEVRMGERLFSS
jgi:phosphatidylserine decarboxylase